MSARGFRRLLGLRLTSQLADGWFQAGLGASVLFNPTKQARPIEVATGFAVLLLPYSLIGPYVGVFLDRWSRRSILHVTNLLRAALVVPAALLILADVQKPRAVLALVMLALAIIGLNRLFLAGLSAATPHVVDDRELVTANAVSGTLGSVCYTVGLGSAALLLKSGILPTNRHGYAMLAAMAPLAYLGSALLARVSFGRDTLGPTAVQRRHEAVLTALVDVGLGMVAGVRHLAGKRGAAYGMLAQSACRILFGIQVLGTLLLFRHYFNGDSDVSGSIKGLGLIVGAGGSGVLLAAFITPPVTRRVGGWRWVAWLIGLVGAAVLGLGLPFRPALVVVLVVIVNLAAQSTKIVVDTAVQHECADEYRGRVFSANDTAFNLCFVAGLFIAALALPGNGHSPAALVLISVGYLLIAGCYAIGAGRWARRVGDDIAGPSRPRPTAELA